MSSLDTAHKGCLNIKTLLQALSASFPENQDLKQFLAVLEVTILGKPDMEADTMRGWDRQMTTDSAGRPREPTLYQELKAGNVAAVLASDVWLLRRVGAERMYNDPGLDDGSRASICALIERVNREAMKLAMLDVA